MATTSTEAVSNSSHKRYRLGQNIINKAREKIWNGDIVATASTHGFWEPDKEFRIKIKVDELKRKFHQNRYLHVKHLPRDVSEEEIRQMLSDFPISSVTLSCGYGSAGSAKAYLEDPEMLDEWDKDRSFLLRGQKIPVNPTLTELVLCVARYPLHYSESHFTGLVSSYGEVKMCFLMISEKTGESKGYGFVEYVSRDIAVHAKHNLDGLLINDVTLFADFIDSTHITFESLHSKCLYVDNLPQNYRDMGEFRRIFSKVVNPPYCQIALKNGCPQNWGLVEFKSADDAENTHTQLIGCELRDKKLRISYYIPGVRAINLYLKLLNDTDRNRGKGNGLLPIPPPGVFQSFKNLQKQNPIFAQSIQNIMVTEQQLGVGNLNAAANSQTGDEGKTSNKSGLSQWKKLGPNNISAPSTNASSDSPAQDVPHDQQAAFLRLLAGQNPAFLQSSQMISFLKQPKGALNGTPVLVPVSLPSDASTIAIPATIPPGVPVIPALPDFSAGGIYSDAIKATPAPVKLLGVNPTLDSVNAAVFPTPAPENGATLAISGAGQPSLWNPNINAVAIIPDLSDKSVNGEKTLLGQTNSLTQRPQRLAALVPSHALARSVIPIATTISTVPNQLVAEPQTPADSFPSAWFSQPTVLDSSQFSFSPPVVATTAADSGLTLINQNALLQYLGDTNSGLMSESLNQYMSNVNSYVSKDNSNFSKMYNSSTSLGNDSARNSSGSVSSASSTTTSNSCCGNCGGRNSSGANCNSTNNSGGINNNNDNCNHINNNNDSDYNEDQSENKKIKGGRGRKSANSSPQRNSINNSRSLKCGIFSKNNKNSDKTKQCKIKSNNTKPNEDDSDIECQKPESPCLDQVSQSPVPVWPNINPITQSASALSQTPPKPIGFEARWLLSNSNLRTIPATYITYSPSNLSTNTFISPPNVTPVGQKRKHTRFLPSPEPSPEGNYIGQHSQGIGGHYLDSWPKRKKKN